MAEFAPDPNLAWNFSFGNGFQGWAGKFNGLLAWAVRSGDVAAVPPPGAVTLLGLALAMMAVGRRERRRLALR